MQKKKGISLIVLVITIIVMIVLAGAIILSLNNAGIIEKANQAVKSTDEATVKELAQIAWAEAYAEGIRSVEDTVVNGQTVKGFQTRIDEALATNGVDTNEYIVMATLNGVDIELLSQEPWVQSGLTLTRGKDKLTIGQTIKYIATGTDYAGEWKVLGADDKGNLLIMSASDVATNFSLYTESTTLATAQSTWLSGGVNKLNTTCAAYGKGTGAIGARSITVEDINKVTKYDPEIAGWGSENIYVYKNQVTYYWDSDNLPAYKYTKADGTEVTGNLTNTHSKFVWYDEESKTFKESTKTENASDNALEEITTLTSTAYAYFGTSKLSAGSEVYKLLFGTNNNWNCYWLASPYVITNSSSAGFGMCFVLDGAVRLAILFGSEGSTNFITNGVRAVVTLQSSLPMSSLTK